MRYIIASNLLLVLLYLCFALLLRRETFHRFNRIVVLAIMLLSLLWPLCPTGMLAPLQHQRPIRAVSLVVQTVMAEEQPSALTADEVQVAPAYRRYSLWMCIYVAGVLVSLCFTCVQMWALWRRLRHARRVPIVHGCTVMLTPGDTAPFSFFHYIVMSEHDYVCNPVPILAHEQAHIALRHSYDLVLLQVFQAVLWFNPFAYLMGYDLRTLHEYEADEATIRQGIDANKYVQLLVLKASGKRLQPFANNLRRGSLKQRVIMMYKRKSSRWAMLKALSALPVVAVVSLLSVGPSGQNTIRASRPFVSRDNVGRQLPRRNADDVVSLLSVGPSGQNTIRASRPSVSRDSVGRQLPRKNADDVVFKNVEHLPVYKTGSDALYSLLAKNMRYPTLAMECGVYGRVYVRFIVRKNGSADSFELIKKEMQSGEVRDDAEGVAADVTVTAYTKKPNGESYLTRAEYEAAVKTLEDEALRVCSMLQGWTPGKKKGQAVDSYFVVPIVFRLN